MPVLDLELTRDFRAPGNPPDTCRIAPVKSKGPYGVDTRVRSLWTELINQSHDYEVARTDLTGTDVCKCRSTRENVTGKCNRGSDVDQKLNTFPLQYQLQELPTTKLISKKTKRESDHIYDHVACGNIFIISWRTGHLSFSTHHLSSHSGGIIPNCSGTGNSLASPAIKSGFAHFLLRPYLNIIRFEIVSALNQLCCQVAIRPDTLKTLSTAHPDAGVARTSLAILLRSGYSAALAFHQLKLDVMDVSFGISM